jgi:PAS domain S-box-containing protein
MSKDQNVARTIERVIMEDYAPASVIINEQGEVVYFSGRTGKYLEPAVGSPSNKLLDMAKTAVRIELRTVVHRALKERKQALRENVVVQLDEKPQVLNLIVRPLPEVGKESGLFIVVFQEVVAGPSAPLLAQPLTQAEVVDPIVQQLEHELRTTREDLQTTIEELETSNEELKSANEELLSMNEELQSTNEELQTSKEEVQSINDELQRKVDELDAANADLHNLFQSTSVATVFLDNELRITRFTPAMYAVTRLGERELGRRLIDVAPELAGTYALEDMEEVLRAQTPREREMSVGGGQHWFIRRIMPYRSLDQSVKGLVLTFTEVTQLKRAEAQRAQLAAIVEGSQDAIIGHAPDGMISTWNSAAEAIYGFSAAEAIGKPISIIVPPQHAHEMPAIYAKLVRGEIVERFHTRRMTKGGELIDASITVSPIRDDHQRIVGFSSIARDVTQLMRAAEQHARLASIVESSDDAIVSKNLDGIVTSWNRGAERIFGYSSEEMVGKPITTIIPADRQHEEPAILARLRRGERIDHYETIRQHKNGGLIDVSVTISPIRNAVGEVTGASKIARDITDERKAEREIELSYRFQAQLASIVESSDDAIISKNLDGIVTSWNRGAERIFGYTSAEMIGKPITTIIPANRQDEEPTILARLRRGERIDHYETVRQRKDGTLLDVSATISPIRNAEGTIIGASKVARDVTEQKQAERLLHEAKESLEKQVALRTAHLNETVHSLESVCYTMAHDLRAPLRSLHGYAEILAEECGSSLDPETKLCTERITTATSRMEQLIEDLLQFAKLGHIDLPVERLDVRTELDRILETIAPEIEVKGAIITLPEPGETAVLANATVFRQVMLNLIVNGMKFVAQNAKPQINITAAKEGPTVRICVKDNGIGIAREHHDRIFGLFQRLHSAEKYPGTGVGLAIVKRGVERMGGRVTLISERGMGSTFCVELPIAK